MEIFAHNSLKKSKKYFCTLQLCVMCGLVFTFLLMHSDNSSQLTYEKEQNVKKLKIILPQAGLTQHNDMTLKVSKVNNITEQNVKLPGGMNESKLFRQKDNNNEQKENQNSNQNINQQKVVKLPNNGDVMEIESIHNQKNNDQQKASDHVDQNQIVGMNATHINGILMEHVNANYTRNIYFTIKTTHTYYTRRLFPQMLTWLQVVDKNKLSIITDKSAPQQIYVDMIRRIGFDIIDTSCSPGHSFADLSCKLGAEFGAYYDAVERHAGKEDDYAWYCHVDDDMYINVPQLSQFLQQYDPNKPYYFGKWPGTQRGGETIVVLSNQTAYHMSHEANYTLKQMAFQYATGAIFCISYAIMMEAKNFFNGPTAYHETYTLAHLPDDMTVGLTIGILLGYNLTEVPDMKNQFDNLFPFRLENLTKYLTISRSAALGRSLKSSGVSVKMIPQQQDAKWVFLFYHCLLYPTVSWCQRTT